MSLASWMFKQRLPAHERSISGLDMLVILLSFVIVHWIYLEGLDFTSERSIVLFSVVGFSYVTFAGFGLYRSSTIQFLHQLLVRLTVAWFIVGLLVSLVAFLSKIAYDVSRLWFVTSMALSYALLIGVRLVTSVLLAVSRAGNESVQSVVLIGSGEQSDEAMRRIEENPWTGYRISRAFLDGWQGQIEHQDMESQLDEIHTYIENQRQQGQPVTEVWVSLPLSNQILINKILGRLQDASVDVCLLPDAFGMQFFLVPPPMSQIAGGEYLRH